MIFGSSLPRVEAFDKTEFRVEASDTRRMAKRVYIYIYICVHTQASIISRGVYMRRDFNPLRIDGLQRARIDLDITLDTLTHFGCQKISQERSKERCCARFDLSKREKCSLECARKSRPKSSRNYFQRIGR